MATQGVFISWSGPVSHAVAVHLRDWLPQVLAEKIVPFVSSEDIAKGARGLEAIASELSAAVFGVVVVTRENLNSVWVNFEAGALSNSLTDRHVAPVLVGLEDKDVVGPLKQFQNSAVRDRDAMTKLVLSINAQLDSPLPEFTVRTLVESGWDLFANRVALDSVTPEPPSSEVRSSEDMLAEVVSVVRGLQRDMVLLSPRTPIFGRSGNSPLSKRLHEVLASGGMMIESLVWTDAAASVDIGSDNVYLPPELRLSLALAAAEFGVDMIVWGGGAVLFESDGVRSGPNREWLYASRRSN